MHYKWYGLKIGWGFTTWHSVYISPWCKHSPWQRNISPLRSPNNTHSTMGSHFKGQLLPKSDVMKIWALFLIIKDQWRNKTSTGTVDKKKLDALHWDAKRVHNDNNGSSSMVEWDHPQRQHGHSELHFFCNPRNDVCTCAEDVWCCTLQMSTLRDLEPLTSCCSLVPL